MIDLLALDCQIFEGKTDRQDLDHWRCLVLYEGKFHAVSQGISLRTVPGTGKNNGTGKILFHFLMGLFRASMGSLKENKGSERAAGEVDRWRLVVCCGVFNNGLGLVLRDAKRHIQILQLARSVGQIEH